MPFVQDGQGFAEDNNMQSLHHLEGTATGRNLQVSIQLRDLECNNLAWIEQLKHWNISLCQPLTRQTSEMLKQDYKTLDAAQENCDNIMTFARQVMSSEASGILVLSLTD
eukprot:scaffold19606_cov134-Skeletonema_marinoi.AAC.5